MHEPFPWYHCFLLSPQFWETHDQLRYQRNREDLGNKFPASHKFKTFTVITKTFGSLVSIHKMLNFCFYHSFGCFEKTQ